MTGKLRPIGLLAICAAMTLVAASRAEAQSFLQRLEQSLRGAVDAAADRPAEPAAGAAEPGWLGLVADDSEAGVVVLETPVTGPAARAGVQRGDILQRVNGRDIRTLDDLGRTLTGAIVGQAVQLQVRRGDAALEMTAVLAARPAAPTPVPNASPGVAPGLLPPAASETLPAPPATVAPDAGVAPARPSLGVRVLPVTDDLRLRHALAVRRGAVITSIRPGSAADRANLPIGAAVVAIDGQRIDSPDDLAAAVGARSIGDDVEVAYYLQDRLFRRRVRLQPEAATELAPAAPAVPGRLPGGDAPAAAPPGLLGGEPRGDRPVVRQLGRALEGLLNPGAAPAGAALQPPPIAGSLEQRVEALERYIGELERRIAELEAQQAGQAPAVPPPPLR